MRIMILFFLIVLGVKLSAQNYPITDRSFAYATAFTMPKGKLQLEGGYFNVHNLQKVESLSLGGFQSNLRYGISGNTELRAGASFNSFKDGSFSERFTTLKLGMKTQLTQESGLWPALSFLAEVEIPDLTPEESSTSSNTIPSFRLVAEKYLNDVFIIGANLGWAWTSSTPDFTYSLALRTAITDEIALYAEYYGRNSSVIPAVDFADIAIEFWVWDNVALDFVVGWGVTEFSDGGFISVGGAVTLN